MISTVKRTLKDHNFYIGVGVGFFVVPMLVGKMKVNVNVPGKPTS